MLLTPETAALRESRLTSGGRAQYRQTSLAWNRGLCM